MSNPKVTFDLNKRPGRDFFNTGQYVYKLKSDGSPIIALVTGRETFHVDGTGECFIGMEIEPHYGLYYFNAKCDNWGKYTGTITIDCKPEQAKPHPRQNAKTEQP